MRILEGNIFPGQGIGQYMLGCDEETILDSINDEYIKDEKEDGSCVIIIENAKFWFSSNRKLIQLGVTLGFQGKYDNKIGIGDTLWDVQKRVGSFYEEDDDYLINDVEGMAFELSDDDDSEWDELTAPIEWIYVYQI